MFEIFYLQYLSPLFNSFDKSRSQYSASNRLRTPRLRWPPVCISISVCLYAPKCLFPVFGLPVLCLHNLREVEKRGGRGVYNLASRKLKRGFDRHAFSFFRECLKPFI